MQSASTLERDPVAPRLPEGPRPLPALSYARLLFLLPILGGGPCICPCRGSPPSGVDAQDAAGAVGVDLAGSLADYDRAEAIGALLSGKTFLEQLSPRWLDGATFWYRRDDRDGRRFVLVDANAGSKSAAFDHVRLAGALSKASGKPHDPARLHFESIAFSEDRGAISWTCCDSGWTLSLSDYECRPAEKGAEPTRDGGRGRGRRRRGLEVARPSPRSPDGKWEAFVRDHDLYLRATGGGAETRLTADGAEKGYYEPEVYWAPDSLKLVANRVTPGLRRQIPLIESSPADQLQPKLRMVPYEKPGDELTIRKPCLFVVDPARQVPVADDLFSNPFSIVALAWRTDSSAFTFEYNQRGHQVYRVLEVNGQTGCVRAVIDEQSDTFIDYNHKNFRYDLADGRELLWASERDGWSHLYLYDGATGAVKRQVTSGPWVMRGVERVDEERRLVWIRGSGRDPGEDPYNVHYYTVDIDGGALTDLTPGDGTHEADFSPDWSYLVDTCSRVDTPPVHELRRCSDGALVCALEAADIADLKAAGWRPLEPFCAKGRDGVTDIYGVIARPLRLDPSRSYPVIESIYAGPQAAYVPKRFSAFNPMQSLAELGFIVVQIDGMGTSYRSRAFHHFSKNNLGDAGIPDRIAWMRAASARYPYMDLARVGVYGTSAGGQNAAGAIFNHGDFYKVAVAACGCHDNRMDKIWWNEMWMGYPIGPHYAEQSNVTNAHKLQGKLLLIVGELDTNVDPASTLQVVDALVKANRDFDLLVLPGQNHTNGGRYGVRRTWDFFVRNLMGVEPRWVGPERRALPQPPELREF